MSAATPVHILTLLALLITYSPLRSCVLQEWTVGSSCHDLGGATARVEQHHDRQQEPQRPAVSESAPHGCVPHGEGEHADTCACERPKLSASRPHAADLPPDALTPPAVALVHLAPLVVGGHRDRPLHPPNLPSPGRSLPLLN